jgi:hypothetical protein
MPRRWTGYRLAVSAFLVIHITMNVIWVLPGCPIRNRFYDLASYYIFPLGLFQYWTMFAPDPVRDTVTLEAQITDAKGLAYTFAFPRVGDYTPWQAIPRFRYSKYVANLSDPSFELPRKFAARHAIRTLHLRADAFPVEAHLVYQLRLTPPPGAPPADPMTPTKSVVIGQFQFATPAEVYP